MREGEENGRERERSLARSRKRKRKRDREEERKRGKEERKREGERTILSPLFFLFSLSFLKKKLTFKDFHF